MWFLVLPTLLMVYKLQHPAYAACPLQSNLICNCIRDVIDCHGQGLSSVVSFRNVPSSEYATLSMTSNLIKTVANRSFVNINVSRLYLDQNLIQSIEHDAFNGLKHSLKMLNLENNKLQTIPSAFMNLDVLEILNIKNNPITSIGFSAADAIFKHLGKSMREFHFGHESQTFWPSITSHFQQLRSLYIYGTSGQVAPPHAFHGFEHTLRQLHITNTKLSIVPNSIGELANLEELYFDDNINVGDQNIMSASFSSLRRTLHTLSLQNNSLTTLPKILYDLQTLHNLTMDRNTLWYISDDAVSNLNSRITYLSFKQCDLDRIPQALLRVSPLEVLDVTDNNIHSIERDDLNHLNNFHQLIAAKNPLKYISTEVFQALPSLNILDFTQSSLTEIPKALKNAPSVRILKLTGAPVECTCDLEWFYNSRELKNSSIQIEGQCDTVDQSINEYIKLRVPNCPK